jgi:pentatricopeptide repeat protein
LRKLKGNVAVRLSSISLRAHQSDETKKAEQVFQGNRSPNTSAYNKLINAYAQKGDTKKAFTIFQQMQKDFDNGKNKQCPPDVRTYNTLLNALQKSNSPDAAAKAEHIFSFIRSPDTVSYTTLANIYAHKGEIEKALNLVQNMQLDFDSGKNTDCCPNMHTYSTILNALQNSRRSDTVQQAEQFFKSISSPNTVTYSTLASIYAQNGELEKALNLVQQMQMDFELGRNRDCRPDMHTYATVLNALQKSNRSDAAAKAELFFNAIPSPNTVAYTTLANIYAQNGEIEKALNLVQQMQMDFDSGRNKDCRPNLHTYNTILNALHKSNRSDAAEKAEFFFNAIPSPDTVTYNTLLNIYANNGKVDKAVKLFQQMQLDFDSRKNKDCRPSMHTFASVLNALQKSNRPDATLKAEQIFYSIPSPNTVTCSTMANIYAQNGEIEWALELVQRMQVDFDSGKNKNCRPNMHTYATILNALHKSNRSDALEKAELFFDSIPSPNTVTYNTLLNIYARNGEIEKALYLVQQMQSDFESGKNKDCRPDMHTYNTILNALLKSNRSDAVAKAEQFFNSIPSPNTVTYTTLLNIYAQNGEIKKALNLVQQMQSNYDSGNKDCRRDMHTCATILNALQKSNRSDALEKAEQFFNSILSPNTVTYNTLLNLYAEKQLGRKAVRLARRMQVDFDSGRNTTCMPNVVTKTTFLKALRIANDNDVENESQHVLEWFRRRSI